MRPKQRGTLSLGPISAAAPGPLYQQIVDAIKREISAGRLEPGTPLPSFRVLAEDLLVSLITVKRAYDELEHEGILFRKQGLGTYISENGAARSQAIKRQETEDLLRRALQEAAEAGLNSDDIQEMLQQLIAETESEREE